MKFKVGLNRADPYLILLGSWKAACSKLNTKFYFWGSLQNLGSFCIDLSKLFEWYVLRKLKMAFGSKIEYLVRTYGNELDFLLSDGDDSIVRDAKYKPSYLVYVNHQDIRQVSVYSRLLRIREKAKVSPEKMLDCVIIYPDLENGSDSIIELKKDPIKEYEKVCEVGLK